MKTENITIKDTEYKLKIGFGTMMDFEEETNKSITDINGKNDIIKLAYSALKYNNDNFKYSYKVFVDEVLDENPAIFIELITKITDLIFDKEGSDDKKK